MSESVVDRAHAFMRSRYSGELRFDENMRAVKYVVDAEGRLAAPVMVAMLQSVDTVLFVPAFADDAMELQVTLVEFQERGRDAATADRWRIYHGEPPDVRWAFLNLDAARFEGNVIDGAALTRHNPLAGDEPRLCRTMNQERQANLARVCARFGPMQVETPIMVGIDPQGIDVRARFNVIRIAAPEPMLSAAQAMGVLDAMAASAQM